MSILKKKNLQNDKKAFEEEFINESGEKKLQKKLIMNRNRVQLIYIITYILYI